MTTPTENWPKPYLLQLHENAVKHGFIWVEGISQADYEGLKKRLYRIRRRSDKSMAAFIPPEYHLVMVGNWELTICPDCTGAGGDNNTYICGKCNGSGGIGRFPLLYDKKADNVPLPTIRVPEGEEIERYAAPELAAPAPIDVNSLDLTINEGEIDDFVAKMMKKVSTGEKP